MGREGQGRREEEGREGGGGLAGCGGDPKLQRLVQNVIILETESLQIRISKS